MPGCERQVRSRALCGLFRTCLGCVLPERKGACCVSHKGGFAYEDIAPKDDEDVTLADSSIGDEDKRLQNTSGECPRYTISTSHVAHLFSGGDTRDALLAFLARKRRQWKRWVGQSSDWHSSFKDTWDARKGSRHPWKVPEPVNSRSDALSFDLGSRRSHLIIPASLVGISADQSKIDAEGTRWSSEVGRQLGHRERLRCRV